MLQHASISAFIFGDVEVPMEENLEEYIFTLFFTSYQISAVDFFYFYFLPVWNKLKLKLKLHKDCIGNYEMDKISLWLFYILR